MTTPTPPPIDVVTVAIALASIAFGPRVAEMVGPYAVIFLGAALGGAWSASRRDPASRGSTIVHMLLMMGLAALITVPLAGVAVHYLELDLKLLLGPVAVVIAGIGHDWPRVGAWAIDLVRGLAEAWAGRKRGGLP
jgi:hypothetical protein